jgi:hypothetical protein
MASLNSATTTHKERIIMSHVQATPIDLLIEDAVDRIHEHVTTHGGETSADSCAVLPCPHCAEPHLSISFADVRVIMPLTETEAANWRQALAAAPQSEGGDGNGPANSVVTSQCDIE